MRRIFTLLALLFSGTVFGQETFGSLSFQLAFPQEEYKETYPRTGWGGRLAVMHRFSDNQPFSIGGELGWLQNGHDSRRFRVPFYGRDNRLQVTATNNVATVAFKVRADLIPSRHDFQLFLEGTAGTNAFFSKANYDYGNYDSYYYDYYGYYPDNNTMYSKNRWTFMWGPGMGAEIKVGKRKDAAIMLKGSYLFGGDTRYLTDPYVSPDGDVFFTEKRSPTTMLIAEAGVRFTIE